MNEAQQAFYKDSDAYLECLRGRTPDDYKTYADLVAVCAPPGGSVLDLGVGRGVSSRVLASRGLVVTGVDLSTRFLRDARSSSGPRGTVLAASAMELPFGSDTFDVVASFELIEHIPDVPRMLGEASRVLRPGGSLVIVGPNLLSPFNPLRAFVALPKLELNSWRSLAIAVRNLFISIDKCFAQGTSFLCVEVIVREGMHSDQDACYLSSPLDLRRWSRRAGFELTRYQKDGRRMIGRSLNRLFGGLGPSIWVVARKPDALRSTRFGARLVPESRTRNGS